METLIPDFPTPVELNDFVIDACAPPSPTELFALQHGQYSAPAAKVIDRARLQAEELERRLHEHNEDFSFIASALKAPQK